MSGIAGREAYRVAGGPQPRNVFGVNVSSSKVLSSHCRQPFAFVKFWQISRTAILAMNLSQYAVQIEERPRPSVCCADDASQRLEERRRGEVEIYAVANV